MTMVKFRVQTLAAAVKEACIVAPTRGDDVAKYAGLYFEIRPGESPEEHAVFLCAAGNGVQYTRQVEVLDIQGFDQDWRISSVLMSALMNALPRAAGKEVTFTRDWVADESVEAGFRYTNVMHVASDTATFTLPMMETEEYLRWEPFDTEGLVLVNDFGERVDKVAWAVGPQGTEPLTGIYLDGEFGVASDKIKICVYPIDVQLDHGEPVVVPLGPLVPILKQVRNVRLRVEGNHLCIAPDDYCQVKVTLLAGQYPNMSAILDQPHERSITINRDIVAPAISRVLSVVAAERQVGVYLTIGDGKLVFYTRTADSAESAQDEVGLDGEADHEPVTYLFGPEHLNGSIASCPTNKMTLNYNLSTNTRPIKIASESGYVVICMPRKIKV